MRRRAVAVLVALGLVGCGLSSATEPVTRSVVGVWEYAGSQAAPATTLEGEIVVASQGAGLFTGTASWEERDGLGGLVSNGGPVMGRVITDSDVDFDVTIGGAVRRHVGRLLADTVTGTWVQASTGRSGSFRAVRVAP